MFNKTKKILCISPHPDDGILAMGSTIAKYIEEGAEIKYLILSWAEQGFNKEEIKNALLTLGIPESHQVLLNYQVRNFPYFASAIRQEFINIRESYKPDIIFCHSSFDFHQDHSASTQEAIRAFRERNLYGYVLPWNVREFRFNAFIEIEKKHLDKKLEALKCLNSQQFRFYYNPDKVIAQAKTFGTFRRKELAEPFEVLANNIK